MCIIKMFQMIYLKRVWRKQNKHNRTRINKEFNIAQVSVGKNTYGMLNINIGTNPDRKIRIGNYCSIAPDVQFIINPHNYKFFTTWPIQRFVYNEFNYQWENKKEIIVEDDVWIGQGAIILGGAVLRQGCVIGAGSIVNKEIPPYAIYADGRIIKYRFNNVVCNKLLQIDYSRFDNEVFERIKGWHKKEITEDNIDNFLENVPLKIH